MKVNNQSEENKKPQNAQNSNFFSNLEESSTFKMLITFALFGALVIVLVVIDSAYENHQKTKCIIESQNANACVQIFKGGPQ